MDNSLKQKIKNFLLNNLGSIVLIILILIGIKSYKASFDSILEEDKRRQELIEKVERIILKDSILNEVNKVKIEQIEKDNKEILKTLKESNKKKKKIDESIEIILDSINLLGVDRPMF